MKRIGFIGVGAMGAPIAERLLAAGFDLAIHDPSERATVPFARAGASIAPSPLAAAQNRDVVFACLPSPEVSRAVALNSGGIIDAEEVGAYVEMSTIGSAAVDAIAQGLAKTNIPVIDAPVSGGPRGARAGTLTLIAAGAPEVLDRCRKPMEAITRKIFRVGTRPGQAQVAKLVNNVISAAGMVASFEAVTMGVKAGLDADTLIDLINASTGRCGATLDKFPQSILTRSFDYGGKVSTMYKDVMLCLEEYRRLGVPHHVSAETAQIWFQGMAEGRGDDDYTSLIRMIENWAGVEVRGRAAAEAAKKAEA